MQAQVADLATISKLPGFIAGGGLGRGADSGRGVGFAVIRKWTDADYERIRTQEETELARFFREAKKSERCIFGCADKHPEDLHAGIISTERALKICADLGVKPYGMGYGRNAFMRATGNKLLWLALIANTAGLFTNANSALGVGDSTTAVAVTQTNLQGAVNNTNRKRLGMVATFPSVNVSPNDNQLVFKTDFPTGNAEFAWNEFATFDNVTDAAGNMFNRGLFSPSPGTKGAGVTWTLTETLTNT